MLHRFFQQLRRLGLPTLILLGATGLTVLLWATRSPPPAKVIEEKIWPVSIETVELRELSPSLQLYGRVESPTAADIASNVSADVVELRVLEGDTVRKGELLIRLDDDDTQIRLRGDETALKHEQQLLDLSRKDHTRAEQLFKEGLASQTEVDAARQIVEQRGLAVAARQQSLATARLTQSRTRITAPFNGRVTRVTVAVGDRATPGQPLVSLYDPARLELRAPVPASYLGRVQQALASGELIATAQMGNQPLPTHLIRLSGEARSGSSNVDGFFRFDTSRKDVEPGRTLEITLLLPAEASVLAVPFDALYQRNRIYVVQKERMHGIPVELMGEYRVADQRARMLVRSPELQNGMQLITTQLPRAIDGLKVKAQGR